MDRELYSRGSAARDALYVVCCGCCRCRR